ncbi:MAG: hypothetical protein EOP56_07555 [Sphingobacteriales bacterium]|nr:MAG: hypothetical protein EOP56_07555 [Sphingobacteriales bacterium]
MEDNPKIGSVSTDPIINGIIIDSKDAVQKRRFFLRGKNVAISISECEDLGRYGFSICHLQDAMIEIARYILSVGGNLLYGGDLRQGGFTEILMDLVEVYKDYEDFKGHRLINFLAWPSNLTLTSKIEAEYFNKIRFETIFPNIAGFDDPSSQLRQGSGQRSILIANALSQMRYALEKESHAKILVGGKSAKYAGLLPGILEEFQAAILLNKPIYLIGGFGGMTRLISNVVKGTAKIENVVESLDYEFINAYNKVAVEKFDVNNLIKAVNSVDLRKIATNSGLTEDEYLVLTTTNNISVIVYLVLKGLNRILNV